VKNSVVMDFLKFFFFLVELRTFNFLVFLELSNARVYWLDVFSAAAISTPQEFIS